jgi:hypothetical protein
MHGLYRYETASGRWWACAEDDASGEIVNIPRQRYEQMGIKPPFLELPMENNGKDKKAANA